MPYEYDVFLSYQRAYPFRSWVHEIFLPLLEPFLANALNRKKVKIFRDSNGIHSGDHFPSSLWNGLVRSRCLVAIWSPLYFQSAWCMHELTTMLDRERRYNYRTKAKPSGLVIPVLVLGSTDQFPVIARTTQHFDCRNYFRVGKAFVDMTRYVEFQDAMLEWVPELARAIDNAPPWRKNWGGRDPSAGLDEQLPPIAG
jgi:hypothetical protein